MTHKSHIRTMQTEQTTRLAYRYRLYPTKAQLSQLEWTLETCRHVYNSLLNDRKYQYEVNGKSITYREQQNALPLWKANHPELCGVFSQVLQNVAKRIDLAFQAFFRRIKDGEEPGYPRFKGRGRYDSITYPQSGFGIVQVGIVQVGIVQVGIVQVGIVQVGIVQVGIVQVGIVQGRLRLSKIGDLNINLHRPIEGDVKTCTIRRTRTGKWFACFSCVVEPAPLPPSEECVGVDVGIKVFAALSNGEFIENPRFFRKDENALAKAQRRFDKVKNKHRTKARHKAKKVVARIHERIKHRRHNFVHQTARRIVNRFGVIAVENLQVDNMMATPKPKPAPENEGQFLPNGASAKAGLNKSIADASWSMFRSILTQKAERAARLVVAINPAYTSQKCSGCENIVKKTLDVRTHRCTVCDLVLDRDTNAAVNIKAAVGQYSLAAQAA